MHSTSVLSFDGGCYSMNILIGCIQSYTGSYSGSSITIRSCLIACLLGSATLIKGLDNLSTMTYGGVDALEEAIHAK
jgi:hypothetical protein